jgi:NADPH-dependent 2,4-dienoyl-CoA reductase/sulfur reductase-like enzyme
MFLLGAVLTPGGGGLSFRVDDLDGSPNARAGLPVVVIGAGPVGLAAAAHLLERGLEPLVLEAGARVGAGRRCHRR